MQLKKLRLTYISFDFHYTLTHVTQGYINFYPSLLVYLKEEVTIMTTKSKMILGVWLVLFILLFPIQSEASFSKKQTEKLNELIEISKPGIPIFGTINTPLKAGVSINNYIPETIYVHDRIALLPKIEKENLTTLKSKREQLHEVEIEGLNFIQPSIELSSEEQKAIDEFFTRNEQEQLLNLWKATIERNKTIQFIIQKLTPASSEKESNSILSRTLGAAIFLPFYAIQAITNNAGAYYGSQVGGRVLGSVIEGKMRKNNAALQLSQIESTILFMMIDEIAERLRQRYHNYKRLMVDKALTIQELDEARKDNLLAQESKSEAASILADIQRRQTEREIRKLDADIRYYKNALIELAGLQVVQNLEEQLKIELAATSNTPLDLHTK